jgi:uncharacterized protein (DUF885 family)
MSFRLIALVIAGLFAAGCLGSPLPAQASADTPASATATAQQIDELFEAYWQITLALNPVRATFIGDHRYNDRYSVTIAPAHIAAERRLWEESLAAAEAMDADLLDAQRQLSRELFIRGLRHDLQGHEFPAELMPLNQFRSAANTFAMLGSGTSAQPFATVGDYQNFLARMDEFVDWVEQAIVNMRQGMAVGVVEPAILMERTLPQLAAHVVERAEDSLFWRPLQQFPDDMPAAEQVRLRAAYADAITRTKGWDRQQVLDYMYANSATLPSRAVSEAERFMAIPGQALAYKVGQLKIMELRGRAEDQLGERFDIRDFHEIILSLGDLPLDVLARTVGAWL